MASPQRVNRQPEQQPLLAEPAENLDVHVAVNVDADQEDPVALDQGEGMLNLHILGTLISIRKRDQNRLMLYGLLGMTLLCVVFFTSGLGMRPLFGAGPGRPPIRGVILMISDGFGPASQTMARFASAAGSKNYYQTTKKLENSTMLPLDTILVGSSRTRSYSQLVTDSAAGATAFACALKTYNGAIGVRPDGSPCGTVLEAAKAAGHVTGLVATSRITHATPACFASHVASRADESIIALQEIGNYTLGRTVDLMFGGGKCFFIPNTTTGSCRNDGEDVLAQAEKLGWTIANGLPDFRNASHPGNLPLMNLFAMDHMAYEIDRDNHTQPSLREMAVTALDLLNHESQRRGTGFFLMIEGSRIDMAGHSNDPAAHVHDILAYNIAVDAVKKFVEENPGVVMISVSDHETGGLSDAHQLGPAYPEYNWYPEHLEPVKHSGEYIARAVLSTSVFDRETFLRNTVFRSWIGGPSPDPGLIKYLAGVNRTAEEIDFAIGKHVSDLSGIGWATHGHSAVDVNLYAYGPRSRELRGNHENTQIGDFIVDALNLDLGAVTRLLNT